MQGMSVLNELDPISGPNKQPRVPGPASPTPLTTHPVTPLGMEEQQLMETLQNQPCTKLLGLSKGQQQLCQLYKDHIPHIGRGAREGIAECQHQFRNRRWNCTTFDDESVFGPILRSGEPLASAHPAYLPTFLPSSLSLPFSHVRRRKPPLPLLPLIPCCLPSLRLPLFPSRSVR